MQQNPDVFLPGPETHYFSTEFHRREGWYEKFFEEAEDNQVVGEKSADYLAHPEAPRRIAQRLPDAKLIVQLRNPIDRAYSDYCMWYRRGAVGANPAHYLVRSETSIPRFLEDGLYGRHLGRFLEFFPRDRIKVILYEDIRERPEDVIKSVSDFIGVTPWLTSGSPMERVKYKEAPLLPLSLRRLLRPVKGLAEPWRAKPWFMAARSRLARPIDYPPLTGDLRLRMRDYYADDVDGLAQLLGRDLTHWLISEGQEK